MNSIRTPFCLYPYKNYLSKMELVSNFTVGAYCNKLLRKTKTNVVQDCFNEIFLELVFNNPLRHL
jgi:hypothetical protein